MQLWPYTVPPRRRSARRPQKTYSVWGRTLSSTTAYRRARIFFSSSPPRAEVSGEHADGEAAADPFVVMAYTAMAYVGMAYIGMAYTAMAYTVMAYVGMAYTVMARDAPRPSPRLAHSKKKRGPALRAPVRGPRIPAPEPMEVPDAPPGRARQLWRKVPGWAITSYGLYSYGLSSYGLSSDGLSSHSLSRHGLSRYGRSSYGLTSHGLSGYGLTSHGHD